MAPRLSTGLVLATLLIILGPLAVVSQNCIRCPDQDGLRRPLYSGKFEPFRGAQCRYTGNLQFPGVRYWSVLYWFDPQYGYLNDAESLNGYRIDDTLTAEVITDPDQKVENLLASNGPVIVCDSTKLSLQQCISDFTSCIKGVANTCVSQVQDQIDACYDTCPSCVDCPESLNCINSCAAQYSAALEACPEDATCDACASNSSQGHCCNYPTFVTTVFQDASNTDCPLCTTAPPPKPPKPKDCTLTDNAGQVCTALSAATTVAGTFCPQNTVKQAIANGVGTVYNLISGNTASTLVEKVAFGIAVVAAIGLVATVLSTPLIIGAVVETVALAEEGAVAAEALSLCDLNFIAGTATNACGTVSTYVHEIKCSGSKKRDRMWFSPTSTLYARASDNPCSDFLADFPASICSSRPTKEQCDAQSLNTIIPADLSGLQLLCDGLNSPYIDAMCGLRAAIANYEPYCSTSDVGPSQRARRRARNVYKPDWA